ncbi:MAG: hypothetical protein KatS3mg129_1908 [Leptospiraceae bacterium]|nr:MAG: hypothetical protein KatS3mg129_1908 [Leptospiraceae bacterium]
MNMKVLKIKKFILIMIYILFVGKILSAYPPNYENALELFKNHKYEESLNKIREVFDNYKNSLEFRLLAASNYIELNDYNSALAHLKYALEDHPNSHEVYILISEVNLRKKQYNTALNILYKAYEQFKLDKEKETLIRLQIAKIFYISQNYRAARKQLETIIAQNPTYAPAFYLDGIIYLIQKNYDLAEFRFNAILSLKKVDNNLMKKVYNNLGFIKEIQSKNYNQESLEYLDLTKEAIKFYKDALKIDSEYQIAKTNLLRIEKYYE